MGNTPSQPGDIATDGDLVLVVGPQEYRIKVDSTTFKRACPLFRALDNPTFTEGSHLEKRQSQDEIATILLPYDYVDAVYLVCQIFHGAPPQTFKPTHGDLERLTVLVDEYDLYKPLRTALSVWLSALIADNTQHMPDITEGQYSCILVRLADLALYYNQTQAFYDATKEILKQTCPPYSRVTVYAGDVKVRDLLSLKLNEARGDAGWQMCAKLARSLVGYMESTDLKSAEAKWQLTDLLCISHTRPWHRSLWFLRMAGLPHALAEDPNKAHEGVADKSCHFCGALWVAGDITHIRPCVAEEIEDQILATRGLCLGCFKDHLEGPGKGKGLHHAISCKKLPDGDVITKTRAAQESFFVEDFSDSE